MKQRGNILFLILLAVVLFAALSYAVTSSMRGGGKDGGSEGASVKAAQIIQYATLIETTFMRLKLSGCGIDQISFEHPEATAAGLNYANGRAPSNKSCHMFEPEGGGVSYQSFEGDFINPGGESANCGSGTCTAVPWAHRGHFRFIPSQDFPYFTGIASGQPGQVADTVMILPFIERDICEALGEATDSTHFDIWSNQLLSGSFPHRVYPASMGNSTLPIDEACGYHTGTPPAGYQRSHYWRIISIN